jgi:hypothetical protein
VKKPVSKFAFQMQPAALQRGDDDAAGPGADNANAEVGGSSSSWGGMGSFLGGGMGGGGAAGGAANGGGYIGERGGGGGGPADHFGQLGGDEEIGGGGGGEYVESDDFAGIPAPYVPEVLREEQEEQAGGCTAVECS